MPARPDHPNAGVSNLQTAETPPPRSAGLRPASPAQRAKPRPPPRPHRTNPRNTNLQIAAVAPPAGTAGLQTGTRGAPPPGELARRARRNPTRKQVSPASAQSQPAETARPAGTAGLQTGTRNAPRRARRNPPGNRCLRPQRKANQRRRPPRLGTPPPGHHRAKARNPPRWRCVSHN